MAKRRVADSDGYISLEDLKPIKKDLEKDIGIKLFWGDDPDLEIKTLPLGIPTLDEAMNGGIPLERFTELWGAEGSGKTTLALFMVRKALEDGLTCAFLDIEKKLDTSWARLLGVPVDNLLIARPKTVEEALAATRAFVRAGIGIVVVDSLAALSSMAELEADPEKKFMGEIPKAINEFLRKANSMNERTTFILINQVREAIGVMYGNPDKKPGGKAQDFICTMIIRVRRSGSYIEEGDGKDKVAVGYNLRIVVEKDQHGTPLKEATVPFYFNGKIDEATSLVETAIKFEVIRAAGAWFYFGEEKWMGKAGLVDAVKENDDLRQRITTKIEGIKEVD